MARIPLVDYQDPDADPRAVAILQGAVDADPTGAPPLNVLRAMANHPDLMAALFNLAAVAYQANSLNPRQRELPYLTSAIALDCFY